MGIFLGSFLSFFGIIMNLFPKPNNFIIRLVLTLISMIFTAIGIFLYVLANIVQLPPNCFNLAISEVVKIKFSTAKIINDIAMVIIPIIIAIFYPQALSSIGIGTIVVALFVGAEIKGLTKLVGSKRDRILHMGKSDKPFCQ